MTSPAPVPQPLRPPPPLRRRAARLVLIVVGALAIAAAGYAIWATTIRTPPPGPLANQIAESIGIGRHPGGAWTYGDALAYNTGTKPVVLDRIWLVNAPPGLRTLETRVAGAKRKILAAGSDPKWPPDDVGDLHPVAGFTLAPHTRPDGERGVELLFKLRGEKPGRFVVRAVGVDYTVGGKHHRLYLRYGLAVCVTAASAPLDRNCKTPETLTPDEIAKL